MTTNQTNNKPHGNVGNRNAVKDDKLDGKLYVLCHVTDKAAWVKQAQKEGLTLAKWVARVLNQAADSD